MATTKKNRKTRSKMQRGSGARHSSLWRADVNALDDYGAAALHREAENGMVKKVGSLLEQPGIDVNVKNNHGNTALIIASRTGGTKIVEMLLEQTGINVNVKGKNDRTALMQAIMMGRPEIVKKLLKKGADITLEDNYGNTALTMVEDKITKTHFPEIKTAIVEEHKKEIVGGRKSSKKTRKARKTRKDHRKKKIKTNKRK